MVSAVMIGPKKVMAVAAFAGGASELVVCCCAEGVDAFLARVRFGQCACYSAATGVSDGEKL